MKRTSLAMGWLLALWSTVIGAHEVPDRVQVDAYINTQPDRLTILVRLPANALIDFLLPALPNSNWLDLENVDALTEEAAKVWIADRLVLYENGEELPKPRLLKVRLSRNNDPAFKSYETALQHLQGDPLPNDTLVLQDQVTVDALLELTIHSPQADFSYRPQFGRLGVLVFTNLAFLPDSGAIRRFNYEGDPPTFHLNPAAGKTLSVFTASGFGYAMGNREMLLALLCIALVLLHAPLRAASEFVLAMTAAEGIAMWVLQTVLISAPTRWIVPVSEVLGAGVVVYLGIESIVSNLDKSKQYTRIGVAAIAGGIIGCVCAASLHSSLQFGGAHPLSGSIGFLFGAALCQILLLGLATLVGKVILRVSWAPTAIVIIIAALAIHVSWWEMLERARSLTLFTMPEQLRAFKGWGSMGLAVLTIAVLIVYRRSPPKDTRAIEPIA